SSARMLSPYPSLHMPPNRCGRHLRPRLPAARSEPGCDILHVATHVSLGVWRALHPVAPRLIDERRSAGRRIPVTVAEVMKARVGHRPPSAALVSTLDGDHEVECDPGPRTAPAPDHRCQATQRSRSAHDAFIEASGSP